MIANVGKNEVKDIFKQSFIKQTEILSNIELLDSMPFDWDENNVIFCIATSGKVYYSTIICSLDSVLQEAVLCGMDERWQYSDRDAYLQEYINIVCGRAISEINNRLKVPSRFSIPFIKEGECVMKKTDGMEFEEIYFGNENGRMKIQLFYQIRKME